MLHVHVNHTSHFHHPFFLLQRDKAIKTPFCILEQSIAEEIITVKQGTSLPSPSIFNQLLSFIIGLSHRSSYTEGKEFAEVHF